MKTYSLSSKYLLVIPDNVGICLENKPVAFKINGVKYIPYKLTMCYNRLVKNYKVVYDSYIQLWERR